MILVTGATGFVGTRFCAFLRQEGRPFRALVRDSGRARLRGFRDEEVLLGSLPDALPSLPEELRCVVHLAGLVRASRREDLDRINGEACSRLLDRIEIERPEARFVLVSSLAAAGPSVDGSGSTRAPEQCRPVSAYGASKRLGEASLTGRRLPWITLRPSIVYGPWDRDVLILFRSLGRGLAVLGGAPGRFSLIHVDDLARAILLAVDSDARGAQLPIAHPQALTDLEWMAGMAEALGKRPRVLRVPLAVAGLTALIGEVLARLRGQPAIFGLDKFRELRARHWVADTEEARRVIGFEAEIGHQEGFAQTVAWYQESGWLPT